MRWILFILAGLAFLVGVIGSVAATTVFQQILGAVAFVVWAVQHGSAAVVEALVSLKQDLSGRLYGALGSGSPAEVAARTTKNAQDRATPDRIGGLVLLLIILGALGIGLLFILYNI